MAATKVLAGQYLNLISRAASDEVVASSEDTSYPTENLFDYRSSRPFKAAAAVADLTLTVDLNMIENGDMESNDSGNVEGWTESNTGTGDVTRTTVAGEFNGGVAGMKLSAGTGTASAYRDVTVRSGEKYNFSCALLGDGTNATKVQLYILETGQYITSAGALSTSVSNIATRTTATWATIATVSFTLSAFSTYLYDSLTLRIKVLADTATMLDYADDVYLWPSWNFASVHGHNIAPAITAVQWRYSTDNFSGSDSLAATMTVIRPAFYSSLSALNDSRYVRLKLVGTPATPIEIGEWVVGQAITLSENPRHPDVSPWEMSHDHPQVRTITKTGDVWAYPDAKDEVRAVKLPFLNTSATYFEQVRDEIMRRSRYGVDPIVLVPWDDEGLVIMGRVDRSWQTKRMFDAFGGTYDHDVYVAESPFWVSAT